MKRGDPIICKKNDYAGLSRYWLVRIFEKEPNTFLKKGETYYILNFDDNIPFSVTLFTEKDFKRLGIEPLNALKQHNISSINWKPKDKKYFNKYFFVDKKEIRKHKLQKINNI
jgi:hypothetical protein